MQQVPQVWCFVCVRALLCACCDRCCCCCQRQYVAGYMPAVVSTEQRLPGAAVLYSRCAVRSFDCQKMEQATG